MKGLIIDRPNHVWSTDITYIRLRQGFVYLVNGLVQSLLSFAETEDEVSNSLDTFFCILALEKAFQKGIPEIFATRAVNSPVKRLLLV